MALTANQRADAVRRIIKAGLAGAADAAVLNKLPDRSLAILNAQAEGSRATTSGGGTLQAGGEEKQPESKDEFTGKVAVTDGPETKLLAKNSVAEWLKAQNAPPEVQQVIANSLRAEREQKADIARRLVANAKDQDTQRRVFNAYMEKSLADLRDLAAVHLTARPAPTGNAGAETEYDRLFLSGGAAPTGNARGGEVTADEDLPLPRTMSAILNHRRQELAVNGAARGGADDNGLHG